MSQYKFKKVQCSSSVLHTKLKKKLLHVLTVPLDGRNFIFNNAYSENTTLVHQGKSFKPFKTTNFC